MDFLAHILDFVARSEWPLLAGVALFLLRRPVERMLDRVNPTKLDAWGFKAEFEKTLEKVALLTNKAVGNATIPSISAAGKVEMGVPPETGESKATDASSTLPTRKGGALSSPEVEILGAWRQLEDALRGSSSELGLDDDEIAALAELRKLRNQVAHSVYAPVTDTEAASFKALTERLLLRINRAPGSR